MRILAAGVPSPTDTPMHRALRTELETTRQAFHALLAALTPEGWERPSHNHCWTIGEVLWHMKRSFGIMLGKMPSMSPKSRSAKHRRKALGRDM